MIEIYSKVIPLNTNNSLVILNFLSNLSLVQNILQVSLTKCSNRFKIPKVSSDSTHIPFRVLSWVVSDWMKCTETHTWINRPVLLEAISFSGSQPCKDIALPTRTCQDSSMRHQLRLMRYSTQNYRLIFPALGAKSKYDNVHWLFGASEWEWEGLRTWYVVYLILNAWMWHISTYLASWPLQGLQPNFRIEFHDFPLIFQEIFPFFQGTSTE